MTVDPLGATPKAIGLGPLRVRWVLHVPMRLVMMKLWIPITTNI